MALLALLRISASWGRGGGRAAGGGEDVFGFILGSARFPAPTRRRSRWVSTAVSKLAAQVTGGFGDRSRLERRDVDAGGAGPGGAPVTLGDSRPRNERTAMPWGRLTLQGLNLSRALRIQIVTA
ncbi:MAG: hypothetical protein ABSB01_19565 [Streptosporangiaceae bacterium]|jgi:hypothetical protein